MSSHWPMAQAVSVRAGLLGEFWSPSDPEGQLKGEKREKRAPHTGALIGPPKVGASFFFNAKSEVPLKLLVGRQPALHFGWFLVSRKKVPH